MWPLKGLSWGVSSVFLGRIRQEPEGTNGHHKRKSLQVWLTKTSCFLFCKPLFHHSSESICILLFANRAISYHNLILLSDHVWIWPQTWSVKVHMVYALEIRNVIILVGSFGFYCIIVKTKWVPKWVWFESKKTPEDIRQAECMAVE